MIVSAQIREARKLLRWSQAQLADRAKVRTSTIDRCERNGGESLVTSVVLTRITAIFEEAGVEFALRDGVPSALLGGAPVDNPFDTCLKGLIELAAGDQALELQVVDALVEGWLRRVKGSGDVRSRRIEMAEAFAARLPPSSRQSIIEDRVLRRVDKAARV